MPANILFSVALTLGSRGVIAGFGLRYFGKAMSCLDEMKREGRRDRYGERNRMPDYRGRGGRSGMREHEEYDDMRQRDDRGRDYRSDYGEDY